ncbi:MAG: sialidase family protein [Candidatus Poribacteria bacterium]|nr:sialidase family protein [Candidatus Poribacteria bacterium]
MKFNQIKFQHPKTKTYLGSPSIIRLIGGTMLATHDYFGPGCPKNHENEEHLTSVYRSTDDGATWSNLTHVANAYWSTLFTHQGDVYLIGTSQQYGSIVIRRSSDGGYTWSHPSDDRSGLLFQGGPFHQPPNYHCAPVPILEKDGRLYRAFEDCTPCLWGTGFQSLIISADSSADLLQASSWTMSNKLPFDSSHVPSEWGKLEKPGWLEGNLVETKGGEVWNILRFNSTPIWDKAAVIQVHDGGQKITFQPNDGFIDFPGGITKFTIRFDSVSELYLTLSNNNPNTENPSRRSVLSLHASENLTDWQHKMTLLQDDSGLPYNQSIELTGFQYPDWQFDGEDIICLVRTAYDGAHNFHDSNRITFHRIKNFRRLIS